MTNILLVRHGQASAGTDNYDRLSETGIEQSKLLGDFWKQQAFHVDAAFSGSLQRQQHTAKLALAESNAHVQVQTLDGLNEYDHKTVDQLYGQGIATDVGMSLQFEQYVEVMTRWRDSKDNHDSLSWEDFSQRGWNTIQMAIQNFQSEHAEQTDTNLVFFTSGGVISTAFTQLMSSTFDATLRSLWQLRNASITQLVLNQDGLSLVTYNAIPHLQLNNRPQLITQI